MCAIALVIDDDPLVLETVKTALETNREFEAICAVDGESALGYFRASTPDLVILDLGLPDIEGFNLAHMFRGESDIPIIMLTSRDSEAAKVEGLNFGADDYVTKPFSSQELVARVRAVLRRTRGSMSERDVQSYGGIQINRSENTVTLQGNPISLTPTEYLLLETFMSNIGRTMTRDRLIEKTFGYEYEGDDRNIDVHIKNLRRKVESDRHHPEYIVTVPGFGYKLGNILKAQQNSNLSTGSTGSGTTHIVNSPLRKPLKILLAEDNNAQRMLLSRLFQRAGHFVKPVVGGQEAVAEFAKQNFDVIFMDVAMPGIDGFEATAAIRELERGKKQNVPIVAMTSYATKADCEECLERGMDDYITKPVEVQDVMEILKNVHGECIEAHPEAPYNYVSNSVFDKDAALARLGGDFELLKEVSRLFLSDSIKLMTPVKVSICDSDSKSLERTAHAIKGAISNFCAKEAFDRALALEKLGQSGNLNDAAGIFLELEEALSRLKKELDNILSECSN